MGVANEFIDKAADGSAGESYWVSCFELINMCTKDGLQTLLTLQIMCRSVFHLFIMHLQEHIFADDEGSSICYRLKTDFADDKIVCS